MKTLRMLTIGMLFAATAAAASAAEESTVATITVTAKRLSPTPAAERIAPKADLEIEVLLTGDMPEAEIDYHLAPIGVSPAPVVE